MRRMIGAALALLVLGCDDGGTLDGDVAVEPDRGADGALDEDGGPDAASDRGPDAADGVEDAGEDAGLAPDMAPAVDMGPPPIDGRAAFVQQCASCHGLDGGGTFNGPDVRNPVDRGYMTYVVRTGRREIEAFVGEMPPYSERAIDQPTLEAMWDWLAEAAKPATGEGLFLRFCANCHDPDGSGGRAGHRVTGVPAGEVVAIVRLGHGGDDYGAAQSFMPAYDTDLLTAAELDLIIAHLGGR